MTVNPVREIVYDQLAVGVYPDNAALGQAAAEAAATIIRRAIAERGGANLILATGNSQLTFLHSLRALPGIHWRAVNVFHMDEYLDLSPDHPSSFSRFLRRHFLDSVPVGAFYPVPGRANDVDAACRGYGLLLRAHPADLCCLGIGENGHLAFNDPPADFEEERAYIMVELDEACRRQQLGEGWFSSLEEVPRRAISMSIRQIMRSRAIVCTVPDRRKARAVRECFAGEVTPAHPASILRRHERAYAFLDADASSLLDK